jgi:hypothetical protein
VEEMNKSFEADLPDILGGDSRHIEQGNCHSPNGQACQLPAHGRFL